MANANAYKEISAWSNELKVEKLTYDFSEDTGAQGTYSLAKFLKKALVVDACVQVETACTSAGLATVQIGTSTGDADAFMDTTSGAVANLVDDFTVKETAGQSLVVAEDETVDLVIGTADLTAGKINVYLAYYKAA